MIWSVRFASTMKVLARVAGLLLCVLVMVLAFLLAGIGMSAAVLVFTEYKDLRGSELVRAYGVVLGLSAASVLATRFAVVIFNAVSPPREDR